MIALRAPRPGKHPDGAAGFTYLEVLVAGAILTSAMLALCATFLAGYAGVSSSGKKTVSVAAARQMMEAIRLLPFASVGNLNGFDTDSVASLPAAGPEREIARRWRYALVGDGVGWTFTESEKARWTSLRLGEGPPLGGKGKVAVTARDATLWEVTVSVNVPGRFRPLVLRTYMARTS